MKKTDELYIQIEKYIQEKQLENAKIALPLAKKMFREMEEHLLEQCLSATKILIDLHIMMPVYEKDLLLAATICHCIVANVELPEGRQEWFAAQGMNPRILELIECTARDHIRTERDKEMYYQQVGANKLALFVTLADRSNLMEQLADYSITEVNEIIYEMRKYLLPVCVTALEYYRECHTSINILSLKIQCLIDVADIIAHRYQKREMAYNNEILSLMEENARLRGMIGQFERAEM